MMKYLYISIFLTLVFIFGYLSYCKKRYDLNFDDLSTTTGGTADLSDFEDIDNI